mmetsp:Transcript_15354/g.50432  ORF Transcript_15354/g.50432 Transcript_15354/m.50432 type:complete len:230 (-) Transcript_15354:791-1480(-)
MENAVQTFTQLLYWNRNQRRVFTLRNRHLAADLNNPLFADDGHGVLHDVAAVKPDHLEPLRKRGEEPVEVDAIEHLRDDGVPVDGRSGRDGLREVGVLPNDWERRPHPLREIKVEIARVDPREEIQRNEVVRHPRAQNRVELPDEPAGTRARHADDNHRHRPVLAHLFERVLHLPEPAVVHRHCRAATLVLAPAAVHLGLHSPPRPLVLRNERWRWRRVVPDIVMAEHA